jgi:hypothetical protein
MNINYRKSLKLVTLLITSLLIATVSASVYNYMYIHSTIGVEGNPVKFAPGTDYALAKGSGAGISGDNQSVAFAGMTGINGTLKTYTDPLKINNTHSTNSYTVQVRVDGTWTENPHIKYVNITMFDNTSGADLGCISLVPSGGNSTAFSGAGTTMTGLTVWRVQWDIFWESTATDTDTTTVNLRVDVSSA